MIKKIMLIIILFLIVSYCQNSYAQETKLGARVWTILPRQQVSETIIRKFNAYQDSISRVNNTEAPELVPEDRPLIITAKQNYVGGDISNEILKIEWYKEIQTKERTFRQIKNVADSKDGPKPLDILGKELYERTSRRNYFWEEVEESALSSGVSLINAGRCRDVYWWTPGRYEISVYQIIARVTDKWGGEFRIGDDELGYPFWTAGIFKVGLNHQVLKVFFQGSLGMGKEQGSIFRSRLLEGGMGGGILFDIDYFGGRVSFSDITKKTDSFLDDINDSVHYYVPFAVQGYYTFTIPVSYEKLSGALRIRAGAGYHQVLPARVIQNNFENRLETVNDDVRGIKRQHKVSPYVRFDYTLKDNTGEAFIQFYNMSLLVGAAYNFTDWFGLEAKFAFWDLFRTRDKWEQPNFLMISPRIRF